MLKHSFKIIVQLCIVASLISHSALAQVKTINKNASPLELSAGLVATDKLNPTLNEQSDALGLAVKSKGQLVVTNAGHWLMLTYGGSIERFRLTDEPIRQFEELDFVSYKGGLLSRTFISDAWYLDTELQHSRTDQKFGFGLSNLRDDVLVADELTENQVSVNLVYGRDTASRYISLKLSSSDIHYADNNDYASSFNYKQQSLDLNLSFRQSSLSRLLVRLELQDDNYDSNSREDSRLYRLLVGVDWQSTGKSSLEGLIGAYRRELATEEANSGLSWSLDYNYRLREDVLFKLSSSRSSVVGSNERAIDSVSSYVDMDFSYLYSQQWQLGVNLAFNRTEYDEVASTFNLDEQAVGLKLTLMLKTYNDAWLMIGSREVSSSDNSVDYRQNEMRLNWRYKF